MKKMHLFSVILPAVLFLLLSCAVSDEKAKDKDKKEDSYSGPFIIFDNWRLPSSGDLNLLYTNLKTQGVGDFLNYNY